MRRQHGGKDVGSFEDRTRYLREYMASRASTAALEEQHGISKSMAKRWRQDAIRRNLVQGAVALEHLSLCQRFANGQSAEEVAFRLCESVEFTEYHFVRWSRSSKVHVADWHDAPTSKAHRIYDQVCVDYADWRRERREEAARIKAKKERLNRQRSLRQSIKLPDGTRTQPIPGLLGYHATTDGRIVSVLKNRVTVLSAARAPGGLLRVRIFIDKGDGPRRQTGRYVHHLVWQAFVGPTNGLKFLFKDGDPSNCQIANLNPVSESEFFLYKPRRHGHPLKLSDEDVLYIRYDSDGITNRALGKQFGVNEATISRIRSGQLRRNVTRVADSKN